MDDSIPALTLMAIAGESSIGKTTLAWKVYQSLKVFMRSIHAAQQDSDGVDLLDFGANAAQLLQEFSLLSSHSP
jgi:molybdopterin-guanine dinucleotide biosynthesis protein